MDDRIIGRIPRSVEMRTPAIVSAMLHVVVLGAAVMNLDFFNRPPLMDPEPVMVDFEMIDKKAAAPKVANPPPQPKDVPIAEEATKAPPPKPAPPKPQPEKKSADSIIDDILKNKQSPQKQQTPETQPKPQQQVTRQAPAAPNLAAVVTASEIEGVRNKIRPCWNTIGGGRDQNLIITLTVQMNQDGTPVKAELKDTGRYNNDPFFRAAADAAHRALMNPRCQPWPLSPEKYNSWRNITFNFDPRDY
jgi:hypothetical protein